MPKGLFGGFFGKITFLKVVVIPIAMYLWKNRQDNKALRTKTVSRRKTK